MWVQAVQQAGSTDVDAVRQAMYGQTVNSLSGYVDISEGQKFRQISESLLFEIFDELDLPKIGDGAKSKVD